ncbi:glycosyltransferase family 4 protein [Arsenicicoccus dermatophilus]|uniref:glycosyltransferase family 4 protein n=1 Tax=Arsenicicoccus dermatophilus TaxID=1076331 RepID=UPI003916D5F6
MRVAVLSDCYLPRLGGIEVQVHDLAEQLVRRGHEVTVLTATPGRHGERHGAVEVVDGVPVHHLALRLPGDLPVNPLAGSMLRERLRDGGFDVAHAHLGVVSPFGRAAVDAALAVGLPTAITWHCLLDGVVPLLRRVGTVRRWSDQGAALSAVSRTAAAQVVRAAAGAPVAVLPNGIDVSRWSPPGGRATPEGTPLTLVTAMRLTRRKRPLPLLRAAREVERRLHDGAGRSAVVDWRLDVYGEGPQRRLLEAYVRREGLSHRVRLCGRVSRQELLTAYRSAAAYVSPTRLEAFGIAALEARTAGLPVLAVEGSGVTDFVDHGRSGLIAPDDVQLSDHMLTILADPVVRQAIRVHNAETPPAQAWPSVLDLVERQLARAGELHRMLRGTS